MIHGSSSTGQIPPSTGQIPPSTGQGSVEGVLGVLRSRCEGTGVSCHPFLLGWYHEKVGVPFHFPYSEDTLSILITSTPPMFEQLFLPYLSSPQYQPAQLDPLDQCLRHFFSELKSLFSPSTNIELWHDFEVCPGSRRPRVLVQTAGHVAGVARYYQRGDVNPDPWHEDQKIYGVSMHPEYGGWFAFRGVLIFKDITAPHLPRVEPRDCVPSQAMRAELLTQYNIHWKDWTFRDIVVGGAKERYSEQQKLYFSTEPKDRASLITDYLSNLD